MTPAHKLFAYGYHYCVKQLLVENHPFVRIGTILALTLTA